MLLRNGARKLISARIRELATRVHRHEPGRVTAITDALELQSGRNPSEQLLVSLYNVVIKPL